MSCLLQVQQRAELLQKEKEETALQQISQLLPDLGSKTHILALTEHDWNVKEAVATLKAFKDEAADKLAPLHKVISGCRPWSSFFHALQVQDQPSSAPTCRTSFPTFTWTCWLS